jgi:hypothetical protein
MRCCPQNAVALLIKAGFLEFSGHIVSLAFLRVHLRFGWIYIILI